MSLDPYHNLANLDKLPEALKMLSSLNTTVHYQLPDAAKAIRLILHIAQAINNPKFQWIEDEVFNPGKEYSDTINAIGNSRLFGTHLANTLSDETVKRFADYKETLKNLQAPIIGTILNQQSGKVLSRPSRTYEELVKVLKALMDQSFMKEAPAAGLEIRTIPPERVLFWDESVLRDAAEMVEKFQSFTAIHLAKMSGAISSMIDVIGNTAMRESLFNSVAKAQLFKQVSKSISGTSEKDALVEQVQNLTAVLPSITKIISGFNDNDISQETMKFKEVLSDQAQSILRGAENVLNEEDLYGIGNDDLSSWDGSDMLGLKAFNVTDIDGMRSYLNAQKEHIQFLARKIAEPALKLLDLKFLSNTTKDINIVNKWSEILKQLEAFDKQAPGNSIGILENFLMYDINQMTREICLDPELSTEIYPHTGDFFLSRLNRLYALVIKSCERINRTNAINSYKRIANFFNSYLAGKYPFTNRTDPNQEEVTASDLNTFLIMINNFTEVDRNELEKIRATGALKSLPLEFIKQIDSAMPLLQATLDQGMEAAIPKVSYNVDFRTNRSREAGADKIIAWSVQIGAKNIQQASDKKDGEWQAGQDIAFSFRWAHDSNTEPLVDDTQLGMSKSGLKINFIYRGRYSLIRALKAHVAQFERSNGTGPITLQFTIPTRYTSSTDVNASFKSNNIARVFINLALQDLAVNKELDKSGRKMTPVFYKIPVFPVNAPRILESGEVESSITFSSKTASSESTTTTTSSSSTYDSHKHKRQK